MLATNDLGRATTTLTQYQQLSSVMTASAEPEPSGYALALTASAQAATTVQVGASGRTFASAAPLCA